jgi:hypothetical protein
MNHRLTKLAVAFSLLLALTACAADEPLQISGIYPHLATFNEYGECGIGAVVPWAGKLWYLTYPPHFRNGSTDKLYELDPDMHVTLRPESVGGTHANRMIHRESNQLIIGPYFIDDKGNVRAADVKKNLVGRMTATARHLTDPANKVYFYDMEGPVYEVDVHTLQAKRLFSKPVPGWHGKGAYTGQGVLVVANNGAAAAGKEDKSWELPLSKWSKGPEEAGVLAEWNGKDNNWKIISRRAHTEVTGPGGIYGAQNDADPIWSVGWDKRSVMLDVRDAADNAWHTYRLPKASHTYDPKHGWYTEWPRIREIVPAKGDKPARLMMTMHGMMFDFPQGFKPGHTAGIRPISSYLRYIPDFCNWNGRVVLTADDTSIMQNPKAGVSQSNLWFGTPEQLADFGPAAGWGGVWVGDPIKANQPSDPYLLAGFKERVLHLAQKSDGDVNFTLEIDEQGDGHWSPYTTVKVPPDGYAFHIIPPDVKGEWIRITPDKDAVASAYFHYLTPSKYDGSERGKLFASLAASRSPVTGGIVRPGKDRQLQFLARTVDASGNAGDETYYEIDEKLQFKKVDNAAAVAEIHKLADVNDSFMTIDDASVLITSKQGRFRLPKGSGGFDKAGPIPERALREVESERMRANLAGIFYEVPRNSENVAGKPDWKDLKPIASHDNAITDFCSWRGLLVLAGVRPDAQPDGHFFKAPDSSAGLWFGAVDDLWRLGKPVGHGGPWQDTQVQPGKPSDPYLMTNFDRKTLTLSHDAAGPVTFTVEVDPTNAGYWKTYQKITVPAGQSTNHTFPVGFNAYWVRISADQPCKATATFVYE